VRGTALPLSILLSITFSAAVAAQSYGPGEQTLTIGAVDLVPSGYDEKFGFDNGYMLAVDTVDIFAAPIDLPAGAEITGICLYAYDDRAGAGVRVGIEAVKLTPGGQSPGLVEILPTKVSTTFDIGYGVVCTPPFSYVYRNTGDVDGDGYDEHVFHRLSVTISQGLMFGGVRIFWHRQISPAPATATFADVPTTHPFFRSVEALAASGITSGCGPGHFCPNQNVTRGEMATFLSRALGLSWPY
jgi:S-layer family protein